MKIGSKLTITFFLIAFLSMLVVGVISYRKAKVSFEQDFFNELTAVREIKSSQIVGYFEQIQDQLLSFSEDPSLIEAMKQFKYGFDHIDEELHLSSDRINQSKYRLSNYIDTAIIPRLNKNLKSTITSEAFLSSNANAVFLQDAFTASNPNPVNHKNLLDSINYSCTYNTVHKKYHPVIRNFMERFGYYDIFLIDHKTGNVVYSVYKELDFASSLFSGPFKTTNFAQCINSAIKINNHKDITLVDFTEYLPSYNAHASFMACPIIEAGEIIGVLAFQMPIDRINNIMTNDHHWSSVGLGKTGETYLIGEDYTLRNQSRFLIEDSANYFKMLSAIGTEKNTIAKIKNFYSTIGLQQVKTEGTQDALKGITATKLFKDYRGVPVLSAYKPLKIFGMNWAILSEIDEDEAFAHVVALRNNIIEGFLALLVVVFCVSFYVSKRITKPLKELTVDALELSKGNFNVDLKINQSDEIGILADGFRHMQTSISNLVHGLEDKVRERTFEVVMQKDIIETKQKEIVDSINYARRIQNTLLPNEKFLKKYLNDYFVIFNPKDIVSGDFYWATKTDKKFYLAVCDSTGHGVPGAFMCLLNVAFLNEAINEKKIVQPNDVLNYVRDRLIKNVSKDGGQDGMDGVLLCIDLETREISYAAAYNAPILIRGEEIFEFEADKMPIGIGMKENQFKLYTIDAQKNDTILLYTDGYADQFGGPKGKKFKYKQLKETFKEHNHLSLAEQREKLVAIFDDWKGPLEQVDDVCVIGIRV